MGNRLEFALESTPIATLITNIRIIEFGGLDLKPNYQRNYIWKNNFKDKLIYSIIKGYPIGNIIIRQLKQPNEKGAGSEIVDGQQRLTTIFDFVEGRYIINSDISRKIIEEIQRFYGDKSDLEFEKLKKKLNNKGKIKLKYADLPSIIKGKFESFNVSITKILEASTEDITEYFRYVQNQERLLAGEILNSLPNAKMEKYLLQIDDLEEFCKILGFDNDRKECDKIFYNIIGLFDNKISLGAPDATIRKYVSTAQEITDGGLEVNNLLLQINKITEEHKCQRILKNTKKRYIKFLMLIMGFNFIDFSVDTESKLTALEILDKKLSVFFSTKPGVVIREFGGYTDDVIEELREVALISKGVQPLERVKNRMEILSYYVRNIEEKTKVSGIKAK